jgi:hypothetical protein
MQLQYKVVAYLTHSPWSENVDEAVNYIKRHVLFEVLDSATSVSVVWEPYWDDNGDRYKIYYVQIGDRKIMVGWSATLVLKARTIDELAPIAKEVSPKIIKALAPVVTKYLLVKNKRVINRDEVLRIVCETFHKEVDESRKVL